MFPTSGWGGGGRGGGGRGGGVGLNLTTALPESAEGGELL